MLMNMLTVILSLIIPTSGLQSLLQRMVNYPVPGKKLSLVREQEKTTKNIVLMNREIIFYHILTKK